MYTNLKTSLFAISLIVSGLSVASCSSDDDNVVAPDDNQIRFSAQTATVSRATPVTSTSLKDFIVYAYTDGKPYMENVKVTRNGSSWSYTPTMYWPSTPVNFYAFSPNINNTPDSNTSGLGTIDNFTNYGTTDLIYAVNMNEQARVAPVNLNFRHALSNVKVMISSSNSSFIVKVGHIKLCNVALRGSFTFPQSTTAANTPENKGSWSKQSMYSDCLLFYAMSDDEVATLSTTPADLSVDNLDVSFMIPQELTALTYDNSQYTGTAIQVDCEIFDAASGAKIWPTSAKPSYQLVSDTPYGRLMYPVTTDQVKEWIAGYAYIYNIVVDNPSALHAISFNVSVDSYNEINSPSL